MQYCHVGAYNAVREWTAYTVYEHWSCPSLYEPLPAGALQWAVHSGYLTDWLIDWYLFNDDLALQLRTETFAVRRRMNMFSDDYDGQMIPGDECSSNFLTFASQFRKNPGKILNQEIYLTGNWTRTRCIRDNDVTPMAQRWSGSVTERTSSRNLTFFFIRPGYIKFYINASLIKKKKHLRQCRRP